MGEFTPPGGMPRMTKAQIKKYIRDLEEKRRIAREKLEEAKKSGVFEKEKKELEKIENIIDDL